jgi:hypothetical protein
VKYTLSIYILISALCTSIASASGVIINDFEVDGWSAAYMEMENQYDLETLNKAVISAAIDRGWTTTHEDLNVVVLELEKRKYKSKLTVLISTEGIEMYSDSYKRVKKKNVPREVYGWIKYLKKSILANLDSQSDL